MHRPYQHHLENNISGHALLSSVSHLEGNSRAGKREVEAASLTKSGTAWCQWFGQILVFEIASVWELGGVLFPYQPTLP